MPRLTLELRSSTKPIHQSTTGQMLPIWLLSAPRGDLRGLMRPPRAWHWRRMLCIMRGRSR